VSVNINYHKIPLAMKTKYTQAILDIHLIENSDYSHHGLETTQNSNTSEGKNSD